MKKLSVLFLLTITTVFGITLENPYIGANYQMGKYKESGFEESNPKGIEINLGTYISDKTSFETRIVFGQQKDTINYYGYNIDVEIDDVISFFLKKEMEVYTQTNIYGLIGYSSGSITGTLGNISITQDFNGLSYGAGASYAIKDDLSFALEYIFYASQDDYTYSAINFGTKYFF